MFKREHFSRMDTADTQSYSKLSRKKKHTRKKVHILIRATVLENAPESNKVDILGRDVIQFLRAREILSFCFSTAKLVYIFSNCPLLKSATRMIVQGKSRTFDIPNVFFVTVVLPLPPGFWSWNSECQQFSKSLLIGFCIPIVFQVSSNWFCVSNSFKPLEKLTFQFFPLGHTLTPTTSLCM